MKGYQMSNNDVFAAVKAMVTEIVTKANAIAEEVKNSRVNVGKVVHEIRKDENTTDETVKAYQAWEAKANALFEKKRKEIDEYIKTNLVKSSEMSDEVFEQKKAEYSEHKKNYNNALKMAAMLPGYDKDTFSDVPSLLTLSGGTSATTGTGPKRPRLASITVNGEDIFVEKDTDEGKVRSATFTVAAAHISKDSGTKVAPSDLSAAAFEAAGTDDLSTVASVEFNYSSNGKEYAIVAFPVQGSSE